MTDTRVQQIRRQLTEALQPDLLHVEDESHLHAGHAGARDGRGHFRVTIVAGAFEGKSRLERHRLVFGALRELMQTDIHAVSLQAHAPSEI